MVCGKLVIVQTELYKCFNSRIVGGSCVSSKRVVKDEFHMFSKGIWAGVVGCVSAAGAACLNTCI